jgi:hypothetical protein
VSLGTLSDEKFEESLKAGKNDGQALLLEDAAKAEDEDARQY